MLSKYEQFIQNTYILNAELDWLESILKNKAQHLSQYYHDNNQYITTQGNFLLDNPPPTITSNPTIPYAFLVGEIATENYRKYHDDLEAQVMYTAQRFVLILALAPHLRPQILDLFFHLNIDNKEFTEFGGTRGSQHKGFLPTGETVMFVLAGSNLKLRLHFLELFRHTHIFAYKNILKLSDTNPNEPALSGRLLISSEYLQWLTTGEPYQPQFGSEFPAQRIETGLEWDDLILNHYTQQELDEVMAWIKHRHFIAQSPEFNKEIKGYRCLFYGESGTGKTLAVTLLGKEVGLDVYRIDLSKIVSKYIGETEKNLSNIFDMAAHREWILFFDEGDALFGKRTQTKSSNDRYANQEVAYLLQKIEEHKGIIILATNLRSNMDKAFMRRFQSEVYFPIPDERTRLILWKKVFNNTYRLEKGIDLEETARRYEMTGASIKNVKYYCAVMALDRGTDLIYLEDFREGLRKQLDKEGKKL